MEGVEEGGAFSAFSDGAAADYEFFDSDFSASFHECFGVGNPIILCVDVEMSSEEEVHGFDGEGEVGGWVPGLHHGHLPGSEFHVVETSFDCEGSIF